MRKAMFLSIMIVIYCWLTAILPDPEYRIWPLLTDAVSSYNPELPLEELVPNVNGWRDEVHGLVIPAEPPEGLKLPDRYIYLLHPDEVAPDGMELHVVYDTEDKTTWYYADPSPFKFQFSISPAEWSSLPTDKLLDVVLEDILFHGSFAWVDNQPALILRSYLVRYPEVGILFSREDFFSESMKMYKAMKEDNHNEIECLWSIDQLEHGEYSFVKRAQIEAAMVAVKLRSSFSYFDRPHVYDVFIDRHREYSHPMASILFDLLPELLTLGIVWVCVPTEEERWPHTAKALEEWSWIMTKKDQGGA